MNNPPSGKTVARRQDAGQVQNDFEREELSMPRRGAEKHKSSKQYRYPFIYMKTLLSTMKIVKNYQNIEMRI